MCLGEVKVEAKFELILCNIRQGNFLSIEYRNSRISRICKCLINEICISWIIEQYTFV